MSGLRWREGRRGDYASGLTRREPAHALTPQRPEAAREDPANTAFATVICASYLFFLAERGANPKVKTFGDALVFISTNMSVGYSDIFARTEAGKYIASAVMTVGPAMVAQLFAPTAAEQRADAARLQQRRVDGLERALQPLHLRARQGKGVAKARGGCSHTACSARGGAAGWH